MFDAINVFLIQEDERDDFQVSPVVLIVVFFMLYCLNMKAEHTVLNT